MKKIIFLFLISCGCVQPGKNAESNEPVAPAVLQDIPYGNEPFQTLDIYQPLDSLNNHHTVIYVHGGAWVMGNKREAVHWTRAFQKMGYTVVSIDYTLANGNPANCFPRQMHDIEKAMQFLIEHSQQYKLDTGSMSIMGASAGGHLALLYAYHFNANKQIKAAVGLCSVLDLNDPKLHNADLGGMSGADMVRNFTGSVDTAVYRSASPLNYISKDIPPTWFIHGSADEIVPVEQSIKANAQLKQFGIPTEITVLNGLTHNLLNIDLNPEFKRVDSFLLRNVK